MLRPLPEARWNREAAAHLANRAGFGATPAEIDALVPMGLEAAVARFVDYERVPDDTAAPSWTASDARRGRDFEELRRLNQAARQGSEAERKAAEARRRELLRMERRTQQEHLLDLRGWWLERMGRGPRPLQEKLVLFWHGHFATSMVKVRNAQYMWQQNEVFRRHAKGPWPALLTAVSKDPAMLVWLDQAQSRREHPNENFAREVMELFTLGEGHYTETDVTEAARAFTGWTLHRAEQRFQYRPMIHDAGPKRVLGRTGNLDGDDVLAAIVAQPQAATFMAARLWSFFAAENPAPALVDRLADRLRGSGYDFGALLKAMFCSEEFYAPEVVRSQVKSPVQWWVGTLRLLERRPPPPALAHAALKQMGQELFAPPNVKGWDGGAAWISTNTLIARHNLAGALVLGAGARSSLGPQWTGAEDRRRPRIGRPARRASAVAVDGLFSDAERSSIDRLVAALERRFVQGSLRPKQVTALRGYLALEPALTDAAVLEAVRLVLCTPEYQLT